MTRTLRPLLALSVLTGLAACGSSNNSSAPPPTVTPVIKTEDMFGAGFGTRYRTDANTQATDPTAADLNPLSLTTQPVPL